MGNNNNNSEQQQQPYKKIKIDNNNNSIVTTVVLNEILKKYDFQDFTISNFLKIYSLFEKYPQQQYERIRLKSVEYFNKYHDGKIPQLIDVYGYIKFILNIFYDPSEMVFNEFKKTNTMGSDVILSEIYLKLLNDKRFNQSDLFKKRMIELESKNQIFNKHICKILKRQINKNSSCSCSCNNSNNSNTTTTTTTKKKEYYLSNILIDKIIGYIMNSFNDEVIEENREVLQLSLVSKQFFKVLSNQLMKRESHSFPLLLPIESSSPSNSFRLTYQPPIDFHYDSFKYIRYNTSKKDLDLIFSKVETFSIHSDQDDHIDREFGMRDITDYYDVEEINEGTSSSGVNSNNNNNENEENNNEDLQQQIPPTTYYSKSTIKDSYIIYPPPMPSLKSLVFYNYCAYSNNYTKLISYIFKSNSIISTKGYKGTIERFYLKISDNYKPNRLRVTKVFSDLFMYHLNSLEIIEIEFWEDEPPKMIIEFFQIFKSFGNLITDKIELRIWLLNNEIIEDEIYNRLIEQIEDESELQLLDELYLYIKNQNKK